MDSSPEEPKLAPPQPDDASTNPVVPDKTVKHKRHLWPLSWSKKKKRLISAAILLAVVGLAGLGFWLWQRAHHPAVKPTVQQKVVKKAAPTPTTVASKLTGVQIAPALNLRPVTGVMIENSPDARPQSGLLQAGVVFEAVAEGGITRFLALYQEAQPDYIGPIRSCRPYYLDWLMPFDAALAHVGGSPECLSKLSSLGVKNLDQFFNGAYYTRVSTRYAPHNVYTSMANLNKLEQSKGFTTSNFTGFARKKETPAKQPTATSIDLTISGYLYNDHYDYSAATNSYLRSEGGKPHIDERSGAQLSPKVVIAMVIPRSTEADGYHSQYVTTGSGTVFVFQDGTVTQGTWTKASQQAQLNFTDQAGQTLRLDPGQTWITMVQTSGSVSYK